ncbi:MAG: 4-alpha-glucanotransferase [Halanaerobiaceae bacterium]
MEHNSFDNFFRAPAGAVTAGEELRIRFRAEEAEKVHLHVFFDNSEFQTIKMEPYGINEEGVYEAYFSVPENPCILWYYFEVITGAGRFCYGKREDGCGGSGDVYTGDAPPYQITVHAGKSEVPDWFQGAIVYQIFVDRFNNGYENGQVLNPKKNSLLHAHWDNEPLYIRGPEGDILRWDFYGGNLEGVRKKLPYLKSLNVDVIYFNPIFKAPSNHKYDIADYHSIDEMFGDRELFCRVVEEAGELGMKVILDGVFSHTGADSIYFNKYGNFDSHGAYQSIDSPYHSWYNFKEHPEDYSSWWGIDNLPEVNELDPSFLDFIIYNQDSVLKYWLEAGIKGWRLDVADELPEKFIREFRRVLKEQNPDSVLLGEVWEDASNKISYDRRRSYLLGGELDATTGYPFRRVALDFIRGKKDSEAVHRNLKTLQENYPETHFHSQVTLLGSHDVPRILTELRDIYGEKAEEKLKLLVLWQMTFPGSPLIYYGDEAGVTGGEDPENRKTYPWGNENEDLLEWYRELTALRTYFDLFQNGEWHSLFPEPDVYGFFRTERAESRGGGAETGRERSSSGDCSNEIEDSRRGDGENTALVLIDRSRDRRSELTLDVGEHFCDGEVVYEFFSGREYVPREGKLTVELNSPGAGIFLNRKYPDRLQEKRRAGILAHVSSLPSNFGIGDMGSGAREFIDFLVASGQSAWQILPLNPPADGRSPYQSYSAFAGNFLLIDPLQLVNEGWLKSGDLRNVPDFPPGKVDYPRVTEFKDQLLRKAYSRFSREKPPGDYEKFLEKHKYWLRDYSLFMSLKDRFGGSAWYEWPDDIASYRREALHKFRNELASEIEYHHFLQYVFFRQWEDLKKYAGEKKIEIIGDLPIFVSHNSCDVWSNQKLFKLDDRGQPEVVAGVPPDYFSETGQYWGNPLYRWDKMAEDDYFWWRRRFSQLEEMMDKVRIDHFRGFEAFWEIPAEEETAVNGYWVPGPAEDFFDVVLREMEGLDIIAENLGYITPEVEELRLRYGFPGMLVLQFMIEPGEIDYFRFPLHKCNNVLYTGTHDNETLGQWIEENSSLKPDLDNCWRFIRGVYDSPAELVVVPLQDFLALGREARMNLPGTVEGNWEWRMDFDCLASNLASNIKNLCRDFTRGQC